MMKCKLLLGISLLYFSTAHAQQYYNQTAQFLNANKVWAFAHHAGLDFNSGTAVPIQTAIPSSTLHRQGEGSSSVSDPLTGKLLFYSDGAQCWNANNQVMPNGDSLLGNADKMWEDTLIVGVSTKQGSCIVPVIGKTGKYYLFSLIQQGKTTSSGSLFYNVVDMSLDNGLGDVVSGQKNILLDSTSLSEAMIAVPGNNCDVWLIVHSSSNDISGNFPLIYKAYHITKSGVDPNPVISKGSIGCWVGSMTISPDRKNIVLSGWRLDVPAAGYNVGGAEIAKFDPSTGKVSNAIKLTAVSYDQNLLSGSTTCAFSPDNTKLYFDQHTKSSGTQLIQLSVDNYDSTKIALSKKVISGITTPYGPLSFRLYDDTIYIAGFGTGSIGTINQPNKSGAACDYQSGAISLLPNTSSAVGSLPSEVVYAFPSDTIYSLVLDTLLCKGWNGGIMLHPSMIAPDYTYTWSDHSTDTMLEIKQNGTYWVEYTNGCHSRVDSFIISGENLPTPIIRVDGFELSTAMSYHTYQWMLNKNIIPGATDSTYTVTQNGNYQVIVSNTSGCIDTSAAYEVTNYTGIEDIAAIARQIQVYPNPADQIIHINAPVEISAIISTVDGRRINKVNNARTINISNLSEGIYFLKIMNNNGVVIKIAKFVKTKME